VRGPGHSLAEVLVVLSLLALGLGLVIPAAAALRSGARLSAAAREMALTLQSQRWRSVSLRTSHGLLFDRDERGWFWIEVRDGNGNGLRTAEVRAGTDPTLSGPRRVQEGVVGISAGFPGTGPFPKIPPSSGWLTDLDDPVKFGATNLISFSPLGSASSGSVYLTDGQTGLAGIVLFGPTCRIRIWRFESESGKWKS